MSLTRATYLLARAGSGAHITLNDDAALIDYAKPIVNEFRASMVRVDSL